MIRKHIINKQIRYESWFYPIHFYTNQQEYNIKYKQQQKRGSTLRKVFSY